MRTGEIVRFDYDNIGRVDSLEIVTVAELFAAAGHPVPDGAMLYWDPWMAGMWWFWTERDTGFFDDDCWQLAHEVRFADHDLSRTPALDMWRCLPECIKAVVK